MSRPSWERKEHPDLIDLVNIMRDNERERWEVGFATLREKEEFLAPISRRWYTYRKMSQEGPRSSELQSEYDDTDAAYRSVKESMDAVRAGLLQIKGKIDSGELVDVTVTANESKPKPKNSIGWLAVGFALLERGLDVLGFHSVAVGGLLLGAAFVCFCSWFVNTERTKHWRISTRMVILAIAAAIYFPVIGFQIYKQYKQENRSAATASQPTQATTLPTPNSEGSPILEKRIFIDITTERLTGFYRQYNEVQANEAVKPYLGKWMKVSGKVSNVVPDNDESRSLSISITPDPFVFETSHVIVARVSDPKWKPRASVLDKGEKVTVIGKLVRVVEPGVFLEECEIVE